MAPGDPECSATAGPIGGRSEQARPGRRTVSAEALKTTERRGVTSRPGECRASRERTPPPGCERLRVNESRIERRLDGWIARAQSPRSAAIVIATVTTLTTLAAGLLMTVVDRDGFPSIGSGLWWAIQTVTTVGYGDDVPETPWGRLVASVVMLLGIGFITIITASITGAFVTRSRPTRQATPPDDGSLSGDDVRQIIERLDRIEAALRERG